MVSYPCHGFGSGNQWHLSGFSKPSESHTSKGVSEKKLRISRRIIFQGHGGWGYLPSVGHNVYIRKLHNLMCFDRNKSAPLFLLVVFLPLIAGVTYPSANVARWLKIQKSWRLKSTRILSGVYAIKHYNFTNCSRPSVCHNTKFGNHYGTLRWEKSSGISATEVKKFSGKQSI